jgi:hypothetical protein
MDPFRPDSKTILEDLEKFYLATVPREIVIPPRLESFESCARRCGFQIVDYSDDEVPPQITIVGEIHEQSQTSPLLEEIAQEKSIIVSEGKNKTIFPGPEIFYSYVLPKGHFLKRENYQLFRDRSIDIVLRQYSRVQTLMRQEVTLRLIHNNPALTEQRMWQDKERNAVREYVQLREAQESYHGKMIRDCARTHSAVFGVFGYTHVLFPTIRSILAAENISYVAMVDCNWQNHLLSHSSSSLP